MTVCGGGVFAGWLVVAAVSVGDVPLTPEVEAAVRARYPGAEVVGVGREVEHGVVFHEVVLRVGDRTVEMEVTPDGAIAEIETTVALAELPRAALDAIVTLTDGAPVEEVERVEVRGRAVDGAFVPVDPAEIVYEVAYARRGFRREITVRADGTVLENVARRDAPEDVDSDD